MTVNDLKKLLEDFAPNCEVFVHSKMTKAKFGVLRQVTGIKGMAEMDTNKWMAVIGIEEPSDEELIKKTLEENEQLRAGPEN